MGMSQTGRETELGRLAWAARSRVLRFLMVGGINTAFGYGAYALLLFAGLSYALAALLGTILGVLFNFLTTGKLVFDGLSGARLARFVTVYAITYAINVATLTVLIGFRIQAYLAGAICLLPMAALSYVLMRDFVFRVGPWH